MKKIYSTTKIYSIIIGIMTFWFIIGILAIVLVPEIENKSGAVFLIIISILGILAFLRSLRVSVSSDANSVYFKTFIKDVKLSWDNITEIKAKRGKAGLYWLVIGKSTDGNIQKINLGILKKKEKLVRDIKSRNPSVVIDKRIEEKL